MPSRILIPDLYIYFLKNVLHNLEGWIFNLIRDQRVLTQHIPICLLFFFFLENINDMLDPCATLNVNTIENF